MREFIQINRDWRFTGPDGMGTAVDLPHTWNAIDGQDGGNDYWRGTYLYEKDFTKPQLTAVTLHSAGTSRTFSPMRTTSKYGPITAGTTEFTPRKRISLSTAEYTEMLF